MLTAGFQGELRMLFLNLKAVNDLGPTYLRNNFSSFVILLQFSVRNNKRCSSKSDKEKLHLCLGKGSMAAKVALCYMATCPGSETESNNKWTQDQTPNIPCGNNFDGLYLLLKSYLWGLSFTLATVV